MDDFDQDRTAYFEQAWHTELSRREQELVLQDANQHKYLKTLWESNPYAGSWLSSNAIPGVTLVDSINNAGMSLVCRGFSEDGKALCVKLPNYQGHSPESWDLLERAIQNEAKVLRQLKSVKGNLGELPEFVSDGNVQSLGRLCPYVSMSYIFGLLPIESFVADGRRKELELWRSVSELLGEVHRCGVIHGDLHQRNLFVNSLGKPILLDFGTSQVHSRFSLSNRLEKRHFGPLLALHIDEVMEPHRPLSYAFDVFCLAELMRRRLGQFFEPIDEISPRLLQSESTGNDHSQQSARFYALIRKCTEPEPEHRLRNAAHVSSALHNLESGPAVDHRRRFIDNVRVMFRKNRWIVALTLTFITFLTLFSAIVVIQFQHQSRLAHVQALQAVKDGETLLQLRKAHQAAMVSMQELIDGAADRDSVLEEVDSSVRQNVANRLIDLTESGVLDLESQVTALSLALQITRSVMDLDGWDSAAAPTLAASKLADQIAKQYGEQTPPTIPLYGIQSLAIMSRIQYEKRGETSMDSDAEVIAKEAARQFLELPQQHYLQPESRKFYIETGYQLAFYALYPQRNEPWLKQLNGDLLWLVIDRSLQMLDGRVAGGNQRFVRQESDLRRLYGLALHKAAFDKSPRFPTGSDFSELAKAEYCTVLDLLDQTTGTPDGVSEREARYIQASVKSVLAMSLTNMGRSEEAQLTVKESFEIRRTAASEFPGSLNRQRDYINTGWNYADAIFSEVKSSSSPSEIAQICQRDLEIRKPVVEKCLYVLSRDRNFTPEKDYLTNAVRLGNAYFFTDQRKLALNVMSEIELTVGLKQLTYEALKVDAIPVLLLHAQATRDHQLLSTYLDEVVVNLEKSNNLKLRDRELVLTRALFSEEFQFVQALPAWPQLSELLRQ